MPEATGKIKRKFMAHFINADVYKRQLMDILIL